MKHYKNTTYLNTVFTFFIFLFSLGLFAQNCDCTLSQVQNNTVTPCNITIGNVVTVNSVSSLQNAINEANTSGGNMTILIADGTYQVASTSWYPYITASNVVFRSLSGNRDQVIIRGGGMLDVAPNTEDGFNIAGNNVTIADLTIRDVGNHGIQVSGHNLYVHNVRIQNTYQQMLKGATSAASINSAIIQCSLFEYTDGIGPNYYIGGLDIHKGQNWIVRENVFKNIISPSGSVAEHAIHFWNNSANNVVERNQIINCDRGIGFGLGDSPNTGGVIRNNMVYNAGIGQFNDVGIGLESSPGTKVYNNTIHIEYQNAIEYRFAATNGVNIINNLTNRTIRARDGGEATLVTNITNAQDIWFVNPSTGDLHLAFTVPSVVDQATDLSSEVPDDIDQTSRPINGAYDIGADELTATGVTASFNYTRIKLFPNPTHGTFTIHIEDESQKSNSGTIEIINVLGEKLFEDSIILNNLSNEINIVPGITGIHFVKIQVGDKVYFEKILFQ